MQDFRGSQQFQIFTACRTSRDKFLDTLSAFDKAKTAADLTAVKRSAIEAMAYNESCLQSARRIDISQGPQDVTNAAKEALLAYKVRIDLENSSLSAIITNQKGAAENKVAFTFSQIAVESTLFRRLEATPAANETRGTSAWMVIAVMIVLVIAFRGYLKREPEKKNEDVGLTKYTLGVFKGLIDGLKKEVSVVKDGLKKKEDDNV